MTSTREVLAPRAADFIEVLLDQNLCLSDVLWLDVEVCGELDDRIDPELGFAFGVLNMNVRPPFLTREEVEPKPPNAKDRRTHSLSIPVRTAAACPRWKGETSGATNEGALLMTGLRF